MIVFGRETERMPSMRCALHAWFSQVYTNHMGTLDAVQKWALGTE